MQEIVEEGRSEERSRDGEVVSAKPDDTERRIAG